MIRKNNKKVGIKAKIRDYMDGVTIDIFGYEKKVSENVSQYLGQLSDENRIPLSNIHVRIAMPDKELIANSYYFDGHIRSITFKELADFFIGEGTTQVFDIEAKVKSSVTQYLSEFSQANEINLSSLNIRISKPSNKVQVTAYNKDEYLSNIPLKELIKYFKA